MLLVKPNFAAVSAEQIWRSPVRAGGGRRLGPPLSPNLVKQLRAAEQWLVDTGIRDAKWVQAPRGAWEGIALRAGELRQRPLADVQELLDSNLIADTLLGAGRLDDGVPLAAGTIDSWRSALRLLAKTGAFGVSFEEADAVLTRAFRAASIRCCDTYVMQKRGRRRTTGYEPPLADVEAMLGIALRPDQGFVGAMVAATAVLSLTEGFRATTILAINGDDADQQGDLVRLRIQEKSVGGRQRDRHKKLRPLAVALIRRYSDLRNAAFQAAGSARLVGLGVSGPLFCGSRGGPWSYERLFSTYTEFCQAAGVKAFTPHALRRVYGSRMVALLGHVDAALAGGWRDPGVLLRSYARPVHDFQPRLWRDQPDDALADALPGPGPRPKEAGSVRTVE